MGRTLRCGVLTLALSAAATGGAQAGDCWLLAGDELEQARAQGSCRDTFARNPRDSGAQTAEVAAVPAKRPQNRVAKAKKAPPDTAASTSWSSPSWSSPREPQPQHTVDTTVVESGTSAVRIPPPAPADPVADPVADVVSGLRQDFDYFVYDLSRDFGAFVRMVQGAASSRRSAE